MTQSEQAALAQENVRAFFQECVPSHRKQYFMRYAERHPELLKEISELKTSLNTTTLSGAGLSYACNRYVFVSKELIRKVSFSLCRAVLPE